MEEPPMQENRDPGLAALWTTEDGWAVWLGLFLLAAAFLGILAAPAETPPVHPLARWVAPPGEWGRDPLDAVFPASGNARWRGTIGAWVLSAALFGLGAAAMGTPARRFLPAFTGVFALAALALLLAGQEVVKYYGLEYALWALLVGLVVSNTIGAPAVLRPAVRTEFYVKTGLVLLGGEILLSQLFALGVPGIGVSWLVTPVVLVVTYQFGQRILGMESKTLNLVISADMSVCGVSAAIATGAACRAKKEEISFAIGLSLAFTVAMMVAMPAIIRAVGMNEILAGAWLGGTIDSTGAVAAAGALVGENAEKVAVTVKMIQNILIGVIAFAVAVLWVVGEERGERGSAASAWEIWRRFPKFLLGFVAGSILFSLLSVSLEDGRLRMTAATKGFSAPLRNWFFCLAFVSIGLESRFADLAAYVKGGKPLVLYVVGQALNLALTLTMAYLMFEVVFPDAAAELAR